MNELQEKKNTYLSMKKNIGDKCQKKLRHIKKSIQGAANKPNIFLIEIN